MNAARGHALSRIPHWHAPAARPNYSTQQLCDDPSQPARLIPSDKIPKCHATTCQQQSWRRAIVAGQQLR